MAELELRQLSAAFGTEVVGLAAGAPLDERTRGVLREAFDERGLLVFRGLAIDRDFQTELADALIGYERPAGDGGRAETLVSNREPDGLAPYGRLLFHSDMMWAPEPFNVLSLYAVDVDPPVVPTVFASPVAAWQALPEELRTRVTGLHAVHVTGQQRRGGEEDLLEAIREREQSVTSTVLREHPRTGRPLLYVGQMSTREIMGLPGADSEALLEELFGYLYDPARVVTHEWRQGDLVVWDNLAVQHARPAVRRDGPVRTLRKVISPIPSLAGIAESPRFARRA